MQYWLLKSEPAAYSIDDLARDGRTPWDGVRNYQARNFMRDEMKVGDVIFFYHSNIKEPGIVGEGAVCSTPYPDETAFDAQDPHYDPKSSRESPRWYLVDICFKKKYACGLSLAQIRSVNNLCDMRVAQKGSRLSVTPVSKEHALVIRATVT